LASLRVALGLLHLVQLRLEELERHPRGSCAGSAGSGQRTTIPGRQVAVIRTADSTLFTFWPPAPPARIVSTWTSDSWISISPTSSDFRRHVDRGEGGMPPSWASKGLIRTRRWTPRLGLQTTEGVVPSISRVAPRDAAFRLVDALDIR